jgi:NADH-quinone oxidoreductase subunit F
MIVIDQDASMVDVAKNIIEFYHHESCGQCTPCREGCGWIDKILEKVLKKEAQKKDLQTILDVCDTMNGKTVCVFAPAVKDIIASIVQKFPEEFETYLQK